MGLLYGSHANTRVDVPVTPEGFEYTQLALVELESTSLEHSGKVSWLLSGAAAIVQTHYTSSVIDFFSQM